MSPLRELNLSDNTKEIIALSEDQRVGFAIGTLAGEKLILEAINVSPPFRRRGFGSQMLQTLENWARNNGAETLTGEFLPEAGMRKPVAGFYEKNRVTVQGRFLFKELR